LLGLFQNLFPRLDVDFNTARKIARHWFVIVLVLLTLDYLHAIWLMNEKVQSRERTTNTLKGQLEFALVDRETID
jgi:hypothetical protein